MDYSCVKTDCLCFKADYLCAKTDCFIKLSSKNYKNEKRDPKVSFLFLYLVGY